MQDNRARAISAIFDTVEWGDWAAEDRDDGCDRDISFCHSKDGRIELRTMTLFSGEPIYIVFIDGEQRTDCMTGITLHHAQHWAKSLFANVEAARQAAHAFVTVEG